MHNEHTKRSPHSPGYKPAAWWLPVIFGLVCAAGSALNGYWLLALGLLLVGASGAAALYYRAALRASEQRARQEQQELAEARAHLEQAQDRVHAVQQLNRSLAEASAGQMDSQGLMDAALATITHLAGALGCSYVPVDEWRQALPAFTYGQLPEPVLGAWAAQLASGMLRERCGSCTVLHSTPGACPLHPAQLGGILTVYCIPQSPTSLDQLAGPVPGADETPRHAGVLHLYLPAGRSIDAEQYAFLSDLLTQVALAFEAARLRQQEQSTLRQLQMLRTPEGDFAASVEILLRGLVQALEVDFALLRVRSTPDERQSNLNVQVGDFSILPEDVRQKIADQAFGAAERGRPSASPAEQLPAWLALPLVSPVDALPDGDLPGVRSGRASGILLVGVHHPHEFHARQHAILQSVAAQAALLVENERLFRSLEYKTVIQERARLAREIHDGLAQTLAFLKLQASQMQSYLAQGDLTRLSQILKDNYQALAEAYLDTRQAIDDLRLTPQVGLEQWVEHALVEFESLTHLEVKLDIRPLSRPLSPEVQAQLMRIVQEALSNVRKHARARSVRVSLFERAGETILEISDDGRGFDAEDVPDITRHGLRGMRERAEMLGADFQIISQALQGTTMRLVIPASLAKEPS